MAAQVVMVLCIVFQERQHFMVAAVADVRHQVHLMAELLEEPRAVSEAEDLAVQMLMYKEPLENQILAVAVAAKEMLSVVVAVALLNLADQVL
jgi:hypothetical protein